MLDPDLLEILACPACRGEVREETGADGDRIACTACGRRYPVRDGIPILLVDEAETPATKPAANTPATNQPASGG
jgi:hypothetical protein